MLVLALEQGVMQLEGSELGGRWVAAEAAVGEAVAGEPGCSCLSCWSCGCPPVVTPAAQVVATTSTTVEISWAIASCTAASSSVLEASAVAPRPAPGTSVVTALGTAATTAAPGAAPPRWSALPSAAVPPHRLPHSAASPACLRPLSAAQ